MKVNVSTQIDDDNSFRYKNTPSTHHQKWKQHIFIHWFANILFRELISLFSVSANTSIELDPLRSAENQMKWNNVNEETQANVIIIFVLCLAIFSSVVNAFSYGLIEIRKKKRKLLHKRSKRKKNICFVYFSFFFFYSRFNSNFHWLIYVSIERWWRQINSIENRF